MIRSKPVRLAIRDRSGSPNGSAKRPGVSCRAEFRCCGSASCAATRTQDNGTKRKVGRFSFGLPPHWALCRCLTTMCRGYRSTSPRMQCESFVRCARVSLTTAQDRPCSRGPHESDLWGLACISRRTPSRSRLEGRTYATGGSRSVIRHRGSRHLAKMCSGPLGGRFKPPDAVTMDVSGESWIMIFELVSKHAISQYSARSSERSVSLKIQTERARQLSPALREAHPISSVLLSKTLASWRATGFLNA